MIDAAAAAGVGATGVGLYRTEYLFLTHPTVPTEEEQVAAYREVIEAAPNRVGRRSARSTSAATSRSRTCRHYREANPFMGWRSIRLTFRAPGVLPDPAAGHPAGRPAATGRSASCSR